MPSPKIIFLRDVSPDPVWDIQRPVTAQRKQVMRGDGLGFAGSLEQKELRQDGNAFEPDGERPEDFRRRIFVGEDEC